MEDDTDPVDRPALKTSEIEVTSEMIEAVVEDWIEENRDSIEFGGAGDLRGLSNRLLRLFSPDTFNPPESRMDRISEFVPSHN